MMVNSLRSWRKQGLWNNKGYLSELHRKNWKVLKELNFRSKFSKSNNWTVNSLSLALCNLYRNVRKRDALPNFLVWTICFVIMNPNSNMKVRKDGKLPFLYSRIYWRGEDFDHIFRKLRSFNDPRLERNACAS